MSIYSAHELPIFWICLLLFAIVFNVFCSNKFEYNVYCGCNSFSSFSRKSRLHSTSVLYSTSYKEVVRLNFDPSLSFLKSSRMLISNSHSYTNKGSPMIMADNVFKKRQLAVDLKFAERLRSSQKNDSLPLVNDIIVTEDLKLEDMIKEKKLSKHLTNASLGEICRVLEYKAKLYGKKYIKIDSYYPSSQECSVCGYKNEEVKKLSVRKWTCSKCGSYHDRDYNASYNILFEGLKKYIKELN